MQLAGGFGSEEAKSRLGKVREIGRIGLIERKISFDSNR